MKKVKIKSLIAAAILIILVFVIVAPVALGVFGILGVLVIVFSIIFLLVLLAKTICFLIFFVLFVVVVFVKDVLLSIASMVTRPEKISQQNINHKCPKCGTVLEHENFNNRDKVVCRFPTSKEPPYLCQKCNIRFYAEEVERK